MSKPDLKAIKQRAEAVMRDDIRVWPVPLADDILTLYEYIRELEAEVVAQRRGAYEWESRCYQSIVATQEAERKRCAEIVCRARDDPARHGHPWLVLENARRAIEAGT